MAMRGEDRREVDSRKKERNQRKKYNPVVYRITYVVAVNATVVAYADPNVDAKVVLIGWLSQTIA